MKSISNRIAVTVLLVSLCVSMSSCEAIAGIFKAGVWVGVLVVVAVIVLLFMIFKKSGNQ